MNENEKTSSSSEHAAIRGFLILLTFLWLLFGSIILMARLWEWAF